MLGKGCPGGYCQKRKEPIEIPWGLLCGLIVEPHGFTGQFHGPEHRSGIYILDRDQLEFKGEYQPEISTASPKGPEEFRMGILLGGDHLPGGQYHFTFQYIVNGKARLSAQIAQAPTQTDPTDSSGSDDSAGQGQPVLVGRGIDVLKGVPRLYPGGSGPGIDTDFLHIGKIDYQAIVHKGKTCTIVSPAADGYLHLVKAGEIDRPDHIVTVLAL